MKPLIIRNWLVDLHDGDDYTWETCSKIAAIMSLVFSFVDENEIYSIRNPMDKVTIPASEEEHEEVKVMLPEQVMNLLERLPYVVRIAVLLVACTGVRVSECLGLRWSHVKWGESRIQIEQTFRRERCSTARRLRPARARCRCANLSQHVLPDGGGRARTARTRTLSLRLRR